MTQRDEQIVAVLYGTTSNGCDEAAIRRGVTFTNLLVRLWSRAPAVWGLAGHENRFPDSRKLAAHLSGHKTKRRQSYGFLLYETFERGRVRLTIAGIELAQRIQEAA